MTTEQSARHPKPGEIWHPVDDPEDHVLITSVDGDVVAYKAPADETRGRTIPWSNSAARDAFVQAYIPPVRDNGHDCPGIGEIQLTRQRGRGVIVDHAPPRALIGLHIIRDLAWPANIAGIGEPDLVNIADQVLYRVVGYDPGSAALVVELVEDWRPEVKEQS